MAIPYTQLFALAYTGVSSYTTLQQQIIVATSVNATNTLTEPNGTTDHANRLLFAWYTLNNVMQVASSLTFDILNQGTVFADANAGGCTDVEILSALESIINSHADAYVASL